MLDILIFISTGIIGGFLTALLGIGGGLLYVSIYSTLIPNLNPLQLITFSLISIALTSNVTAYQNKTKIKANQVKLAVGALSSLLLFKYLLSLIDFNGKIFSIILLAAIAYMVVKKITTKGTGIVLNFNYYVTGLLSGIVSSITGLGGGIVLNPLLSNRFKTEKELVEFIINVIAISTTLYSIILLAYQFIYQTAEFEIINSNKYNILAILAGTFISKGFAKKLSNKISDKNRTIIFLIMVIALAINTIIQLL